ncbi:MAG: hypothetical protein ACXVII_25620 [Solirubrobacteraceae bacterium]
MDRELKLGPVFGASRVSAHCAELLSRYAEAGSERIYLWPLGDESRQVELAATSVLPAVKA